MTITLLTTAAMEILTPLLTKGGEKAVEKISEKIAETAVEKGIWKTIKSIFIVEDQQKLETIENQSVASSEDMTFIREQLGKALEKDPDLPAALKVFIPLTGVKLLQAETLHKSLAEDAILYTKIFRQLKIAPAPMRGGYEIMLEDIEDRMKTDEKKLKDLIQECVKK